MDVFLEFQGEQRVRYKSKLQRWYKSVQEKRGGDRCSDFFVGGVPICFGTDRISRLPRR